MSEKIKKRNGAYLPHWTRDQAVYGVTFRLADSLPKAVLERWIWEKRNILVTAEQMGRPLSEDEEKRLRKLHSERVEQYLDAGLGACWMKNNEIAEIVATGLRYFDGQRYVLHAWCVMPNHVHVIVEPFQGFELSGIMHSWKSFTAKKANSVLCRKGRFWQEEYYDHLIRHKADFRRSVRYVCENPIKAGLHNWRWVWSDASG